MGMSGSDCTGSDDTRSNHTGSNKPGANSDHTAEIGSEIRLELTT
jgi:hypothetical protein